MMRAMRENTKWIFYILAFALVGWMVFDVGMGVTGKQASGDVVLKVNGTDVHNPQFQDALQAALTQYRQQNGGAQLSDDDEKQVEDRVVEQLVQEVALQQTYRRLGITVSNQELIDAARNSPLRRSCSPRTFRPTSSST